MEVPIFQVDAFTDRPFKGNPAAVCLLTAARDAGWMQAVAAEMNLSETAFLHCEAGAYHLRWFTPRVEVDLCGHATLASAHILWSEGHAPAEQSVRFLTRSGPLAASRRDGLIELDFPLDPPAETAPPEGLLEALGARAVYVGRGRFDYLVELESEQAVRAVAPDFARLARVQGRGVIVTARCETRGFDFVSRFFAPQSGIDEDPVTGSAHCCLGAYWSRRLGRTELAAYQASPRGGVIRVRLDGGRALLAGHAVTVLRGTLMAD